MSKPPSLASQGTTSHTQTSQAASHLYALLRPVPLPAAHIRMCSLVKLS